MWEGVKGSFKWSTASKTSQTSVNIPGWGAKPVLGDLVFVWGYVKVNCGMPVLTSILHTQPAQGDLPAAWGSAALLELSQAVPHSAEQWWLEAWEASAERDAPVGADWWKAGTFPLSASNCIMVLARATERGMRGGILSSQLALLTSTSPLPPWYIVPLSLAPSKC